MGGLIPQAGIAEQTGNFTQPGNPVRGRADNAKNLDAAMTKTSLPSAVPLDRAMREAPGLAGLIERMERSSAMLRVVRPLIPPALEVKAGPVEDAHWCLLTANNAGAAKLRQLVPALASALHSAGWPSYSIKVKVMARDKS